jgi:predicted kinase
MTKTKTLVLLRGLPGSGKSTVAKLLQPSGWSAHYEADMYFMQDGEYKFDPTKLRQAHSWCASQTEKAMVDEIPTVTVSNTFTQEWEMETYYALAEKHGYTVVSMIVENRHGGKNVHGVPEDKLQAMADRFQIKLK